VAPVFAYPHGRGCGSGKGSLGRSVIGGAFAGDEFDIREGAYVFGDFISSGIYLVMLDDTRTGFEGPPGQIVSGAGGPVDIVSGPDGAIYYTAIIAGEIRRVTAVASPAGQQVSGSKLKLTDNDNDTKKALTLSSRSRGLNLGAGNGSVDDPTIMGGSLRVLTANGCGGPCDTTYDLPAGSWTLSKGQFPVRSYKFADRFGTVRSITLRPGSGTSLKISAKGAGLLHELAADPGPVDVVLTIGGHSICMEFGGTTTFRQRSTSATFSANGAPSPADCP
jgi:hypothetical protein